MILDELLLLIFQEPLKSVGGTRWSGRTFKPEPDNTVAESAHGSP
ncbi:hypothetical protein [Streptomyces yangpuensis]